MSNELKVHTFHTTGIAYNCSQTDDDIKNGDVLVVPEEGVVGFLLGAWPVAVTKERGVFHSLPDPDAPPQGEPGDTLERRVARVRGWFSARTIAIGRGYPLDTKKEK